MAQRHLTTESERSPVRAASLAELPRAAAELWADHLAVTFLADGESVEVEWTYRDLLQRAAALAAPLRDRDAAGQCVAIMLPQSPDYLASFFACQLAGAIAVPVFPAAAHRRFGRLEPILADCGAKLAFVGTSSEETPLGVEPIGVAEVDAGPTEIGSDLAARPSGLALLQYTSGSTRNPRGVMLSHDAVLANVVGMQKRLGTNPGERAVQWVPQFHDMGLVNMLYAVHSGLQLVLMPPIRFIQRPVRWLEAISNYQAVATSAPNFAFQLCADSVDDETAAGLDLRSWRSAICGAEPVRVATFQRFCERFAVSGFNPNAFCPSFGLAEFTVAATMKGLDEANVVRSVSRRELAGGSIGPDRNGHIQGAERIELMACGEPLDGHSVRIVDPDSGEPQPECHVGEIWLAGPSRGRGYFGQEQSSGETFAARLPGDATPWLRTGDLGFLEDGRLYVTGRRKDLLILRGLNYYPQDIEWAAAESHPGLRGGLAAAMAVESEDGESQLMVVQEAPVSRRGQADEILAAIRARVEEATGLRPASVLLLRRGEIPTTTSGKVRRAALRERVLSGEPSGLLGRWDRPEQVDCDFGGPETALETADAISRWLLGEIARRRDRPLEPSDRSRGLFSLGVDSLEAAELLHELTSRTGRAIDPAIAWNGQSLDELAEQVVRAPLLPNAPQATQAYSDEPFPLTPGQEGMWLAEQLDGDPLSYLLATAFELYGELDAAALARAVDALTRRHPALRTVFFETPEGPRQRVLLDPPPSLERIDASDWSDERFATALAAWARRKIDLSQNPIRLTLARRGPTRHLLLLAVHHLVSDFGSLAICLEELGALYAAECVGGSADLRPLSANYRRHVAEQRAWIASEDGAEAGEYWKQRLAGELPLVRLPGQGANDAGLPAGAMAARLASPALGEQLAELARQHDASLFTLLLTAYFVFLQRHTGQNDLVVGSYGSGRGEAALAGAVGFFASPWAVRIDLADNPTFVELLARVQRQVAEDLRRQSYPVNAVAAERGQTARLYATDFTLQQTPWAQQQSLAPLLTGESGVRLPWGGLEAVSWPPVMQGAPFEFSLAAAPSPRGLLLTAQYQTQRFAPAEAERFLARFERLLADIVERPAASLTELDLLTAADRESVARECDASEAAPLPELRLHESFAQWSERCPDAVALSAAEGVWTYAELNRRASAVAAKLLERRVEPGAAVGLLLPTSSEAIVALLSILKAGCGYAPLDPAWPELRLRDAIASAGISLVLTSSATDSLLPGVETLNVSSVALTDVDEDTASPFELPGDLDDLAYLIFTSGSTGTPKAVRCHHRGVVNLLADCDERHPLPPGHAASLWTSLGFDVSVYEIFACLTRGGRLELPPEATRTDAIELFAWLADRQIASAYLPPFLLAEFADWLERTEPPAFLQRLLVGVEPIPAGVLQRIASRQPGLTILNGYGPTETAICATLHTLLGDEPPEEATTIGCPVRSSSALLLDARLRSALPGCVGELYVSGPGVALGYAQDPARTAERFLPDPRGIGRRMYRTGDLARRDLDDRLHFQGRIDQQIKRHGHRIELGEIESVLTADPSVRVAKAVVFKADDGDSQVAAYVIFQDAEALGARQQIAQWQAAYDAFYREDYAPDEEFLNLRVWQSSYEDAPLPLAEIRECVADTVARIELLRPTRVLEIGCGSGLILSRIAPSTSRYVGVDLSAAAISRLQERIAGRSEFAAVELAAAAAHEQWPQQPGGYDLIVLNEIVQHFPSIDYLLDTLRRAVAALAPNGSILLGGLWNARLLELFHLSVVAHQQGVREDLATADHAALRTAWEAAIAAENELRIDPAWFDELVAWLPEISETAVLLKGGRSQNELTRFKYDVLLRRQASGETPTKEELDWGHEQLTLELLSQRLASAEAADRVVVRGVPNPRIATELRHQAELRAVAPETPLPGIDPAALVALAEDHGWSCGCRWAANSELGEFEAVFARDAETWDAVARTPRSGSRELAAYANRPLGGLSQRGEDWLLPLWRRLEARLPSYMLPAAIVPLEALPLTVNGKLDRSRLPRPTRTPDDRRRIAPRTETQRQLAAIFAEVLRLDAVGVEDSFFALGGHSLLAAQAAARIREQFGRELKLAEFFAHPSVAALAEFIDDAEPEGVGRGLVIDSTAGDPSDIPSFAQQRLWFLDQLEPGQAQFNMPGAVELVGPLEVAALRASLAAVANRQESLRTTLINDQGAPRLQLLPENTLFTEPEDLPLVDLTELPPEQRSAAAERQAKAEAQRPFALDRGPLVRGRLVKLDAARHWLLLTLHHAVADGWSLAVMVRDVAEAYAAARAGRELPSSPLGVRYRDFADWQRQWLESPVAAEQLAWWRDELRGAPASLELPTDHPRPQAQSSRGGRIERLLPAALRARLTQFGHDRGATEFMTLLALWQALLSRWAGQDEVVVGTPVAGRRDPRLENLVGLLVNMLPVRTRMAGAPSLTTLVERVRTTTLAMLERQDVPFERLVEELAPERDPSRPPLFQVMFAYQNAPLPELELEGLALRTWEVDSGTAKYDLTLDVEETPAGLRLRWEYAADLYEADTIERMAAQFEQLAAAAVDQPQTPLIELDCLPPCEQETLRGFCQGSSTAPPTETVVTRFEQIAASAPDQLALRGLVGDWTYAELEARSRQIAEHLGRQGIGRGSVVAVAWPRSPELIAALLGVARAGAAYLPLDVAHPPTRLAWMIADSQAKLLIAAADFELGGVSVPRFDPARQGDVVERNGRAGPNPAPAQLDDLAYLLYTSGSTGQPKGVAIGHAGLANIVDGFRATAQFGPDHALLSQTTPSFDIFNLEWWLPLTTGGQVVVADPAAAWSGSALADLIERFSVSHLQATPVTYQLLLDSGWRPRAGQTLWVGGEALPPTLAADLADARWRLINGYGPTEASIWATAQEILPGEPIRIGRPLPNYETHVLDDRLRPTPIGVPGELYLGGIGLASHYWRRPELTAGRFTPHPQAKRPGARLYRTGDRVRWLTDGTLEFLGRIDRQVKVRGFRIELGEIEAHLSAHPDVAAAAAVVRGDDAAGDLLAGFVAPHPGGSIDLAGLRDFLRERLPAYSMPSLLVPLEHLPRLGNGKLDRRALLETPVHHQAAVDAAAWQDEIETQLAAIWTELLPAPPTHAGESFFELGGHSLLATQLVARIAAGWGVQLPLIQVFQQPTLGKMAAAVRANRPQEPTEVSAIPRLSRPTADTFEAPLSSAQQRLWFLQQLEPDNPAYHLAGAVRISGPLDTAALQAALVQLVERQEMLRTVFVARDGQPRQRVLPEIAVPWNQLDLRSAADADEALADTVRALVEEPFDLTVAPLFRVALAQLDEQHWVLCLCLHHILGDGWSLDLFVRELGELYAARQQGRAPSLPPLAVRYADYAAWQRERLQDAGAEADRAAWVEALADAPPALELPTDRPRPTVQTYAGAEVHRSLSPRLVARLEQLAAESRATLFMTLLAAWQAVLARLAQQETIVVGAPVAGRGRQELEGLVGLFVNTLPLRADVSTDESFRELLAQVRQRCLAAFERQDVPLDQIIDALRLPRDAGRSPVFQTVLALQNHRQPPRQLGPLTLEPLPLAGRAAHFDLTLLWEPSRDGSLVGTLEYNTDLFDPATAERLLATYVEFLAQVVDDADRPLAERSLLLDADRERLLNAWAGPALIPFEETSLAARFEAVAAEFGEEVAVETDDDLLRYDELNRRSNQLARLLIARGLRPRQRVALALPRGISAVVATLAVLKAGGCYVPLEPDLPPSRLAWLLEDSQARQVIGNAATSAELPTKFRGTRIDVEHTAAWADFPADNLEIAVRPGDPAYLMYTSGSTGRPKGAAVPQRAVLRLVAGQSYTRFAADETWLLHAPLAFDAATLEIWAPLLHGGRLVIAPPGLLGFDELAAVIDRHEVTSIWLTAGLFDQLAVQEDDVFDALGGLRQLLAGGDVLPPAAVRAVQTRLPRCQLINGYGPTENTTFSCCHRIAAADTALQAAIPIGRPIAGTQAYVLDERMQLAPVGAAGELYLGGLGLANGYWRRADLSAERFVPHPWSKTAGARLYRTGDRVRWRSDGTLDFLGRWDRQVKVRGFRIELGEIEAAAAEHPAAVQVAVVVQEEPDRGKRLVLFVAPRAGATLTEQDMREFLAQRLPLPLRPQLVEVLPQLPQSQNGKIDRKTLAERPPLPVTGANGGATAGAFGPLAEKQLAAIWSELLPLSPRGPDDNFFELGGDSILALQVVARAAAAGWTLQPRDLFLHQTLAELAAAAAPTAQPADRVAPANPSSSAPLVQLDEPSRLALERQLGGNQDGNRHED